MWQLWHSELRRNWRPAAPCGVTVTVMKYLWLPFLAGTPFSAFLLYLRYINFVKLTLSHIPSIPHCTLQAAFLHLNADTRYFRCIDIQYLCMQQNWIERFSVRLWSMKIHKSNQLSRRYQKNIDAGPMCKCEEILWKNNFLCHQIYCITSQVSTDLQAEQNTNLYWLLHYWYRVSDNIDIITINKEKVL